MEGIARYVQIKSAEAAEHYQPSPEYAALPDYLSFESYAREARSGTLSRLEGRSRHLAANPGLFVWRFRRHARRPLAPQTDAQLISGRSLHLIRLLNPALERI